MRGKRHLSQTMVENTDCWRTQVNTQQGVTLEERTGLLSSLCTEICDLLPTSGTTQLL